MDDGYTKEQLRRRRWQKIKDAAENAALSGTGSGAVLGGVSALLSRKPRLGDFLKATLAGGVLGGGVAGTSTLVGSEALGPPQMSENQAYTRRGGLGGAVTGGALGAAAGGIAGSGVLGIKPGSHFVADYFQGLSKAGRGKGGLRGAAIGGLLGGVAGAYSGSDEGMQLDFVRNEVRDSKLRAMKQEEDERRLAMMEDGL